MPKTKRGRVKHRTTPRSAKKYWCDCTNFDCYGGSWVSHEALLRHAKHKVRAYSFGVIPSINRIQEEATEERRSICPQYADAPPEIQELIEQMTLQSLDTATLFAFFTPPSSKMYYHYRHFIPQLGVRLCDEDSVRWSPYQ